MITFQDNGSTKTGTLPAANSLAKFLYICVSVARVSFGDERFGNFP
jgi:hypothetical protein